MVAVVVAVAPPVERGRLVVVASSPAPSRVLPSRVQPSRVPTTTVYRRRRTAVAALLLAAVVVVSLAFHALLASFGGGPLTAPERSGPVYVVQPGDTFWDIAGRIDPTGDPRPLVALLVAAHGGPVLRAGERIALPPAS